MELGKLSWNRVWQVFCLIPIGVGMSLNGSRAIFEALIGKKSPFIRTPKYAVGQKQENLSISKYLTAGDFVTKLEILFALYYLVNTFLVIYLGNVYLLPAILIFGPGYFYLAYLTLSRNWDRKVIQ